MLLHTHFFTFSSISLFFTFSNFSLFLLPLTFYHSFVPVLFFLTFFLTLFLSLPFSFSTLSSSSLYFFFSLLAFLLFFLSPFLPTVLIFCLYFWLSIISIWFTHVNSFLLLPPLLFHINTLFLSHQIAPFPHPLFLILLSFFTITIILNFVNISFLPDKCCSFFFIYLFSAWLT